MFDPAHNLGFCINVNTEDWVLSAVLAVVVVVLAGVAAAEVATVKRARRK